MSLDCPKGNFKKGDIVRYDVGATALMRLSRYSGGRWHGEQFFGGYASQTLFYPLRKAGVEGRKAYRTEEKKRHKRIAKELRQRIGDLKKQLKELRP